MFNYEVSQLLKVPVCEEHHNSVGQIFYITCILPGFCSGIYQLCSSRFLLDALSASSSRHATLRVSFV